MTDVVRKASSGEIPPSRPIVLAELISYATGSVVSRTIYKSNAGTITLFAFDRGEGLSEHSAPHDAFVQVLDGRADLTVGGERLRADAGQTVRMPANVPHALHAPEPFKMMLVMVRG